MINTAKTLLTMSVTGAVVTLITLALHRLISRRLSRTAGYYIRIITIAAFLIPVIITLPKTADVLHNMPTVYAVIDRNIASTSEQYPRRQSSAEQVADMAAFNSASNKKSPETGIAPANLLLVLPIGAAVFLIWNITVYARFSRMLKRGRIPATERDFEVLSEIWERCPPLLFRSAIVPTPMLLGIINHTIYLPDTEYSDGQLRAILTHELVHLRRGDVIVKWLAVLANAVHWFNPLAYIARRGIGRACELATDEAVIKTLDRDARIGYGETLIDLAAATPLPYGIASMTLIEGKSTLKERITAIAGYKSKTRSSAIVAILIVLVLVSTVFALGARREDPDLVSSAGSFTDDSAIENSALISDPGVDYNLSTPPVYPVNAKGQTYGAISYLSSNPNDEPDLIACSGIGNIDGYCYKKDLDGPGMDVKNPEEARQYMKWLENLGEYDANGKKYNYTIPLYESDGETVIGEFKVSHPAGVSWRDSVDSNTAPELIPVEALTTEEPYADAVEIRYAGISIPDKDVTMSITENLELSVRVTSEFANIAPVWKSGDESKLAVVYIPGSDTCSVTAINSGTTVLTCTVGDEADSLTVRIP